MIRYRYVDHFQPPAPFVNVSLRCITLGNQLDSQPALVDTAADRTVLPAQIVETLGLVADGRASFQGFGGDIVELPLFLVELRLHDLPPIEVRVTHGEHEPFILLGRDVLNVYRILLDGPQQVLEI
jgi:Aspartyl protease